MDDLLTQRAGFEQENFASRRTTGHNLFDPESLLTGAEEQAGFTYLNSRRKYPSDETREAIIRGDIPTSEVPTIAPRELKAEVSANA
jgi:hypothetical protein